jgi:hypothetical protein
MFMTPLGKAIFANIVTQRSRSTGTTSKKMIEDKEYDPDALLLALKDCYAIARRNRAHRRGYAEDGSIIDKGPKSDDADWDHVIRFCERAGLKESIIRTGGT